MTRRLRYNGRALQQQMLADVDSALENILQASQAVKTNPELARTHVAWTAADLERLKRRILTDLEQVLQRQESQARKE
jgi:hypothetical protein